MDYRLRFIILFLMLSALGSAYPIYGGSDSVSLEVNCVGVECDNITVSADLESSTSVEKALRKLQSTGIGFKGDLELLIKSRLWESQGIIIDYNRIPKQFRQTIILLNYSGGSKIVSLNTSIGFIVQFYEPPVLEYKSLLVQRLESAAEGNFLERAAAYADRLGMMSKNQIVEISTRIYADGLRHSHKMLGEKLRQLSPQSQIRAEYSNVFNGISVVATADEIAAIATLPNVKMVYPIKQYTILLSDSVPLLNADDVWLLNDSQNRSVTGQNVTVAIIDTGVDYTHVDLGNCSNQNTTGDVAGYSLNSTHPYTNSFDYTWTITVAGFSSIAVHFDRLEVEAGYDHMYIINSSGSTVGDFSGSYSDVWSASVAGDTIRIRLTSDSIVNGWGFAIDEVINGSTAFSWNCERVIGGFDFVNNDSDPMDDNGHGTHVAGIVGANSSAIKGIAPDIKIIAYKVCDSGGSCPTDYILAGVDRSVDPNQDGNYSDRVDIISMSLGGTGDPDDSLSQAIDNAVDAGIIAVIAAGNDGPSSNTIACPACARKAIAVGAVYTANTTNENRESQLNVLSDSDRELPSNAFQYSNLTADYGVSQELYDAGLGYPANYTVNASGKIALIERGSVNSTLFYFYEKVANASAAGAVAAIIYNNEPGNFLGTLNDDSAIPAVSISQSNGTYLKDLLANGSVRVNLTVTAEYTIMAEFSSRGPSYIFNKPDVVAPGVQICSTQWANAWNSSECIDSDHTAISGTSMATPHVAGVVALVVQKHPDWTPLEVKAALENTAYDYGLDRNAQGAGRVDALAAVSLNTTPPVSALYHIPTVDYR